MKHYDNLRAVPQDALKPIEFGPLKGKSDINPQWRWEALTKEFGACGEGWKYEVAQMFTKDIPATGEVMVFITVNLFFRTGESWSAPIPGFGGDFLIVKDKNGIHGNDEAYKMALTDALGSAAKMIGLAADVYRGLYDTKYRGKGAAQDKASARPAAKEAPPREDKRPPEWIRASDGRWFELEKLSSAKLLAITGNNNEYYLQFHDKANEILNRREAAA